MTKNSNVTPPRAGAGSSTASCATGNCPPPHIIHMHLDADRDGIVDTNRTGLNRWEWGAGKKGAIVLCNNDDDDNAGTPDNEGNVINGNNDSDETAPLVFRALGSTSPTPGQEGFIEVTTADARRLRIFDGGLAGSREVIGPTAGNSHKIPSLNFTELKYTMEATGYAGTGFNGLITINFIVKESGVEKYSETAKVRVAPWMMPNHNDAATKAYVVNRGNFNRRFRRELNTLVRAASCTLDQSHRSNDIWMQDCMEIGFSNLPNTGFHAVTRAPRDRPLKIFPRTLLGPDFGYHEVGTLGDSTFDSTGNLEVTPPCASAAGKQYPFGRIYYGPGRTGERIDPDFKAFLNQQIVQKPIEIDTGWLTVGHVDEIISFVPAIGGAGFKLLLASPQQAYQILNANLASHGTSQLLTGRSFGVHSAEVSISRFLRTGIPSMSLTAASLLSFNNAKQAKLDSIKNQFVREIGIDPVTDVINVPILFMPNEYSPIFADALTAGMVNMLVLNKHCIVPKPFGPVVRGRDLFEDDLSNSLTPLGLTVNFLDDWEEYHVNLGEVHCGTNTLRAPTSVKWWEFEP